MLQEEKMGTTTRFYAYVEDENWLSLDYASEAQPLLARLDQFVQYSNEREQRKRAIQIQEKRCPRVIEDGMLMLTEGFRPRVVEYVVRPGTPFYRTGLIWKVARNQDVEQPYAVTTADSASVEEQMRAREDAATRDYY